MNTIKQIFGHKQTTIYTNVCNLISIVSCLTTSKVSSLIKLKTYLQRIKTTISTHTKSANYVIAIIVEKYNIINIDCFEVVVDHLEVTKAKFHISYKKMLTVFYEEVSLICATTKASRWFCFLVLSSVRLLS